MRGHAVGENKEMGCERVVGYCCRREVFVVGGGGEAIEIIIIQQ